LQQSPRKGLRFGNIAVDIERRTVIDILPDRSLRASAFGEVEYHQM
jgi:hypothetical protein